MLSVISQILCAVSQAQPFTHPGCLSTSNDFARMKAKVQAGEHPWIDSWNILVQNPCAQLNYPTHPQQTLTRGGRDNYQFAYWDTAAAYQQALRWKITGETRYADSAITS